MLFPLLVSLALPVQAGGAAAAVPPREHSPVTVRLSDSSFARGGRARVYVQLRAAAYLLVLHVNGEGRIRVLFPQHPVDDALVPGGRFYEIPGPDDREAIAVGERDGTGTVLAARSSTPFRFDLLARGNDWDYPYALLFQPTAGDPLAALLDIVERLANGRRFDVDVTTYAVTPTLVADSPSDSAFALSTMGEGDAGGRYVSAGAWDDRSASTDPVYADSFGAPPSINAVCSNSYVAEGSVCGSVLYNPTFVQSPPENPSYPDYYPYYAPFLYDPLFLPVIVIERPVVPPPPRPAQVLALPPRPSRVRVITPPPRPPYPPQPPRRQPIAVTTIGPRIRAPASGESLRLASPRPPVIVSRSTPEAWTRLEQRAPVVSALVRRPNGTITLAMPLVPTRPPVAGGATAIAVSGVGLPVTRRPEAWSPPVDVVPGAAAPPASGREVRIVSRLPFGVPVSARPFATATMHPATASAPTTRAAQAFPHPIPIVPRSGP